MRGRNSREKYKEEGRGLGEGSFAFGKNWGRRRQGRNSERGEEGGNWRTEIVLGRFYRGTAIVGNFWLGGQETERIRRARELERLFLVGWEVNIQFGQLGKNKNKQGEVCILLVGLLLL
jgi:hypothetical protein